MLFDDYLSRRGTADFTKAAAMFLYDVFAATTGSYPGALQTCELTSQLMSPR